MAVELIFTLASFAGLAVFYWEDINIFAKDFRRSMSVRFTRTKLKDRGGYKNTQDRIDIGRVTLTGTVQRLIHATLGVGSVSSARAFTAASVTASIMTFFVLSSKTAAGISLIASLFALSAPFTLMLYRLQKLRIENSREGDILITELLDNYKMNYFNMQKAIDVTALTIREAPHSRKLLFNLSKGLNTASSDEEIRKLVQDFSFAIGTSWSGIMADNMYFALTSGIRVTEAMESLIKTVEKARKVEEFVRRENNEGKIMLKYMAPCCYCLTVLAGVKYFGLSFDRFIQYQFMSETGLTWFVIVILTYSTGIAVKAFLSRSKMDL